MNKHLQIILEPDEIINFIKSKIKLKEICINIASQKIIEKVAREKGINVTTEEIEIEANRQRREKRLEKASDTVRWLEQEMLTPLDWEVGIRNRLLSQKLASALFDKEVEQFFLHNRLEFEQVALYQFVVKDEKLAQELYYQIEEGEISFYQAARIHDIDKNRRYKCGYEGKVYRWAVLPEIVALVFNAPLKQLIGPIKTEYGYHLFIVEDYIPAELTPERYEEILNRMFGQWLNTQLNYTYHSFELSNL
ncbi:peptidylprolyl isomerase [Plectonema cf. radiosum LEGE 06105]|uniref:peptidylprolyl isomerase n=1 Tax=Plectonema cf. radiosum LEGE 06105 TaxID=945769 RepID=A0A8J7JRG7_9CYAN|nr:peptidylprolyl isomerase [Plectonema radiosum]MBE9211319.1 peptidylprolyl isomerase [Plectonema cf. radiosum LEGE 06105]